MRQDKVGPDQKEAALAEGDAAVVFSKKTGHLRECLVDSVSEPLVDN
ncbi:hypothetical protein [Yoonia sp. SS1-5]|uniref:Uncharacterized protein n=1 Tax=Yoonia rhodophyticola TaxID=3137370 RepID=A0ABZ3JB37_9RHOB